MVVGSEVKWWFVDKRRVSTENGLGERHDFYREVSSKHTVFGPLVVSAYTVRVIALLPNQQHCS